MRTIYLDSEYRCHVTNDGTMTDIETDFFDGKCDAYIEATRFVPSEKSWTREDGRVFEGEASFPLIDSRVRAAYQEQYEANQTEMADMQEALALLGVTMDE